MKKFYSLFRISLVLIFSLTLFSKNSSAAFSYKSARIISLPGDTLGTFVRIAIPQNNRYTCGSPVVIYMLGGFAADGMIGPIFNMANYGCIVIQFNYPGGGKNAQKSGGTFDDRGPNCILAAHDVMKFALGQIPDKYGNYLHDYTGTKTPLYDNVGLIGGSNGGCQLLVTLGTYPSELSGIAWVSFFESPIGDGLLSADQGKPLNKAANPHFNGAYNDMTGEFNWELLKFNPERASYKLKKDSVKGLFYFDLNLSNQYEEGIDYSIVGRFTNPMNHKYYFSQQIVDHAYQMGYYPPPPSNNYFADSAETRQFWQLRNGDSFIDEILQYNPDIKVMYMARHDSDHITCALDHPEVMITYQKFMQGPTPWFKLNADRSYLEYIVGHACPTAPDNDPNAVLTHANIRYMDIPGELTPNRYHNHYSTTLEMADRTLNNQWINNLTGLLPTTCPGPKMEVEELIELPALYPNPASTEINVQINANAEGKAVIRVFDVLGKEVIAPLTVEVENEFNLVAIDISNLSAGNYFVRINAPGFVHTLQFTRE